MEKISCAILAGGKSERLPNKQFLNLGKKPLISYVLCAAEKSFEEILVVVKNPDQVGKIKNMTENKRVVKIFADNSHIFSPWSGIKTAAENAKTDWIFLLACDMPFVTKKLFEELASKITSGIDCVIPFSGRLQPLCALYRKSVLEKAPMEGSLTRFAESLRKVVVRIDNPDWLFNINTKEDFEKAEELIKTKKAFKD